MLRFIYINDAVFHCMSYDYYIIELPTNNGHREAKFEHRRYDDASVDANGKYQRWSLPDKWHPLKAFDGTMTESSWTMYYDTLSPSEKQEFSQRSAARKSSNSISGVQNTDLRPMSELLSGLQSLYET
jgi:hypothetical protein